ncbi:MAG: hypothetical protein CGU29_04125 [Candidatus Dactylopiibacterium carminicum]|uniref:Uncharacterized protein n=1 Tax=Candidatus Dactylopiibacterium carminicum TaxID=857335 RepID=A0A272EWL0_9RHOO|nr:hypothetical protein BGI27_09200 [Candidatus Dactylopiibacterium carminicum]PAS94498.1 MAG: hypothetical protein CGU29_04125 [Candidatus Dactylopiibacterium carminicum]PAS99253.1 MAG: hypothetical protein BSR46_09215 [Candidatus Dactylopiibacterium carminicum]
MRLLCVLLALFAVPAGATTLACHISYGGETQILRQAHLRQVRDAYVQAPQAIGFYFLFRPVFEPAAVKLYTYVDHPDGPVLLHQASFSHPAATRTRGRHGFTGEQRIYEPIRDSELQYWCEIEDRP